MSFRRPKRLGTTLIETIVMLGILSVIIVGSYQIFHEGIRYFRTIEAASDAQMDALKVLGQITTDLSTTRRDLIKVYSGPGGPVGIVFVSPLTDSGATRFHKTRGDIYWQKWVCFYLDLDPSGGTNGKVYRCEENIPNEDADGPGSTKLASVVKQGMTTRDTTYFKQNAWIPRRLLGSKISQFDIEKYAGDITDDVAQNTSELADSYVLTVEAGDPSSAAGPEGYYIKVSSLVVPMK